MSITVNGQPAEEGCYGEGHRGQYLADRFADVAETFGLTVPTGADARRARRVAAYCEHRRDALDYTDHPPGIALLWWHRWDALEHNAWGWFHESADKLRDIMNDVTEGGSWDFHEGELYLLTDAEWEEWSY